MVFCPKLSNILIIIKKHCIIILCVWGPGSLKDQSSHYIIASSFFVWGLRNTSLLCLAISASWLSQPSNKNNHLTFSWNCSCIKDSYSYHIYLYVFSLYCQSGWSSSELIIKTFIIWRHKNQGDGNIRLQTVSIMWSLLSSENSKRIKLLIFCNFAFSLRI